MRTKKYKILVLSDLKNSVDSTLKSTVSLAKIIGGEITFFHVKKASEVVEDENQLSAKRTINQKHFATKKKIESLINPIKEAYGVNITTSFSYGNVKHEIESYLEENKPDIIVLGKRKSSRLGLIGDNITSFVLHNFNGVVMIASNKKALEPSQEIGLGMLNASNKQIDFEFAKDLIANTQKPLKSFKIIKKASEAIKGQNQLNENSVEYVFEQADNNIKVIDKYLSKNNINLLCIDRASHPNKNKLSAKKSNIEEVIDNLNVSFLVTGSRNLKTR